MHYYHRLSNLLLYMIGSRYAVMMIALLMISCFESKSPLCWSGIRCPVGMQCSVDGLSCTIDTCGDGVEDEGEACDHGAANSNTPDACRRDCQLPRCGDGIIDSGEVCDDGNNRPYDGCSADCESNETCGNGYPDALVGETCDDGNTVTRDGCSSTCQIEECSWREYQHQDSVKPSARAMHVMAYDASRGRVVLFGGDAGSFKDDTWEWDGRRWKQIEPLDSRPSARSSHAMAYDVSRGRVVLFGGYAGPLLNDTWEWDGRRWEEIESSGARPSVRRNHAMAYDASRGRVVLFGGYEGILSQLDDTWEWDGRRWEEIEPSGARPSARGGHTMAYDASRGRVVLFGGDDTSF